MDEVKLTFARFQCGRYFARQLDALRAFRGDYVSGGLLENLEVAGLLAPQIRLHYPDDVARRFWSLDHPEMKAKGTIEPDGARWDIAVELRNALYRWHRQYPYGPYAHPFESGEARYEAFFLRSPFGHCNSERERGVDVSNDVHPTFSNSSYEQTFYTTWQLLVATEIADCSVHFRINLADDEVRRAAWEAVGEGRAPGPTGRFAFRPVHAMRGFEKHARALDAVVLFAEERQRGLDLIVQNLPGRFRLSEEQNAVYQACRRDAAQEAVVRYQVNTAALVDLCRFLAERWCDWHRDGRPLIAGAYKAVLGEPLFCCVFVNTSASRKCVIGSVRLAAGSSRSSM